MTILSILTFLFLCYFCGFGPTLLLLRPDGPPRRILVMPVVGLCAYTLVALPLAQLSLTGSAIAPIALAFFGLLAVMGCRKSAVTREELIACAPAMLLGLFSAAVFGWPLIQSGYGNFWGLANPDQAYLMPILDWIKFHPFGVPPDYVSTARSSDTLGFRNIPVNALFGVYYLIAALSWITTIPAALLFNITMLGLVYMMPGGVCALSEALGLPSRTCLTAAALMACSSLAAYTFYLDSLGALGVIAVTPAAVALALRFIKSPELRTALPSIIVCAGIYFGYLGNIGFMGLLVGTVLTYGVLSRALPLRKAVSLGAGLLITIIATFPAFALGLWKAFLGETFSQRFATTANSEILLSLSMGLTERVIPQFWGLWFPGIVAWPFSAFPESAIPVGMFLSLFLLLVYWRRVSGLPVVFGVVLGAILAVIANYIYRINGYGVFKLVAWAHPFIVVGLSSAVLGGSSWLRARRWRRLAWTPYIALALYVVPNLAMVSTVALNAARHSAWSRINNAPLLTLREVRELSDVATGWGAQGIVVSLPDAVTTYWTLASLRIANPKPVYLPNLSLVVRDSAPRQGYPTLGRYLLHWNTPATDVVAPPVCPAVWSNRLFALSVLDECRNVLVFGEGWYRFEQSNTTPWLRRFRWLGKRGELLLINPDSAPQRLRVSVFDGPGNSFPRRTLSVFLNGKEIDSFTAIGTARVLTKPFVATGPVAQLQIEVKEDASPLPRRWALWNRWVPEDPRRLNIAVTQIALVGTDAEHHLPASLNLLADGGPQPLTNGFFADRWMGAEATVTLTPLAPADEIGLTGTIPGGMSLVFPFHLELTLNGARLPSCAIARPGPFQLSCPIPPDVSRSLIPNEPGHFGIKAEATFTTSGDPRQLSLQLERIDLTQAHPTNQGYQWGAVPPSGLRNRLR